MAKAMHTYEIYSETKKEKKPVINKVRATSLKAAINKKKREGRINVSGRLLH